MLPPLIPAEGAASGGAGTPGSESRDGRRSVALGVPSLRLAARDSAEPSHYVDSCLTKLANDQPCSRELDDETGEPSTQGAEESDHRRVRMGTSSFNKQERLERKEMDNQPDKPEPAKRQRSLGDATVQAVAKVDVKPQDDSEESDKSDIARSKSPDEGRQIPASRDLTSPEKRKSEKEVEDEVEFKKLSSEFKTLIEEDKPELDDVKYENGIDRSSAENERPRRRRSSFNSGRSSPGQERPKQMFEIPDEMRLAAGVAQDRRSRADRPARSALFSSTEVLVEQQTTPTLEQPTTVNIDLQEDDQETPTDEQIAPAAMPRTVITNAHLSESMEEDSVKENKDALKKKDSDSEQKHFVLKKDYLDSEEKDSFSKDDSESGHENSKPGAKDERSTGSSRDEEDKVAKPVEEEELKKTVRSVATYQDDAPSSKIKIDKLEAFKEVLSLTPSKSSSEKRAKQEKEVDVVGETVEKNHVDRCPCDGPTSNGTAPRITGEVTGLVEVGEKKPAKTEPVTVALTEHKPRPAEADERTAPPTSAAVSRARSEAAALPEAVRAVRAARRRDSGGPVAEVLSRDAAASGRLCSSTGDLTRSEPPRADSPLGRTVSMQTGVGDQTDGEARVSAAACARDQMDLSRLQEGYEVTQPRHIMSTASSNESLDTESIQEEPEDAAHQPPPPGSNGVNGHGPEADDETRALSEKGKIEKITVNGIGDGEDHREEESFRHSSENGDAREHVRVPSSLPRIVQSELKRNSESDSADEREQPADVSSLATREPVGGDTTTIPSAAPAVVAPPIVIEPAPERTTTPCNAEGTIIGSPPVTTPHETARDVAQSVTAPDTEVVVETTPVAHSRRGPPPTPPPRSPASRQAASPASPREPERFEISATELDSVMVSHEEFLRQEAERRARVFRMAANFRSSREPSPAPE